MSRNYILKLQFVLTLQFIAAFLNYQTENGFEKSSLTPSLGLRIVPLFADSKIDLNVDDDLTMSDTPPWSQSEPHVCVSLTTTTKRLHTPELYKHVF